MSGLEWTVVIVVACILAAIIVTNLFTYLLAQADKKRAHELALIEAKRGQDFPAAGKPSRSPDEWPRVTELGE